MKTILQSALTTCAFNKLYLRNPMSLSCCYSRVQQCSEQRNAIQYLHELTGMSVDGSFPNIKQHTDILPYVSKISFLPTVSLTFLIEHLWLNLQSKCETQRPPCATDLVWYSCAYLISYKFLTLPTSRVYKWPSTGY